MVYRVKHFPHFSHRKGRGPKLVDVGLVDGLLVLIDGPLMLVDGLLMDGLLVDSLWMDSFFVDGFFVDGWNQVCRAQSLRCSPFLHLVACRPICRRCH